MTKPIRKTPIASLWQHMGPLARIVALPIYAYRYTFSPFVGHVCRHQPTCSVYALEALAAHGAFRGFSLAIRRVLRCHPYGQSGYDPVPGPQTREQAVQTQPHKKG